MHLVIVGGIHNALRKFMYISRVGFFIETMMNALKVANLGSFLKASKLALFIKLKM